MRTRDAANHVFNAALMRETKPAKYGTHDAIRRATRKALGLRDAEVDDEHPGSHFLAGSVDFFHDHPLNCGKAELAYKGPEFTRADAQEMMEGMGFSRSDSAPEADTYNKAGKAPIAVMMDGKGTQDRRARDRRHRDDDEGGNVSAMNPTDKMTGATANTSGGDDD